MSFFPASDRARLHYHILERYKCRMLGQYKSWSHHIRLDSQCVKELQWWLKYLRKPIVKSLHKKSATVEIQTDASSIGFRGQFGLESFQGRFTPKQQLLLINTKELLAIYYVLSMLSSDMRDEVVHVRCDNMCALFCLRNFGFSSCALRDEVTRKIFYLAFKYNYSIISSYIPSKENLSDMPSRLFKVNQSILNGCSTHQTSKEF